MDPGKIWRYRSLYRNASRMGADRIFAQWVGLPPGSVVPLSIAHGVDFGHWDKPIDIEKVEPIHWAHNEFILARSINFKPTVLAPHPMMMLTPALDVGRDYGTLVIGAPPGPENDIKLYQLIKHLQEPITVLVKPRGCFESSIRFWNERGMNAVTAGREGPQFYLTLHGILTGARKIIACNLSSAVVFSSALGKPVELLRDYWHHTYMRKVGRLDFSNPALREIVLTFLNRSTDECSHLSRTLLGAAPAPDSTTVKQTYLNLLDGLQYPLYFRDERWRPLRQLLAEAARVSGKTGFVNDVWQGMKEFVHGRDLYATRINEIALWESGDLETYCRQASRAKYAKGETEGGFAVLGYADDP